MTDCWLVDLPLRVVLKEKGMMWPLLGAVWGHSTVLDQPCIPSVKAATLGAMGREILHLPSPDDARLGLSPMMSNWQESFDTTPHQGLASLCRPLS
jgi:hypothetical protein